MLAVSKRFLITLIIAALICAFGYIFFNWYQLTHQPLLKGNQPVTIFVRPGMGAHQLAWTLKRQQLISKPRLFETLVLLNGDSKRLKAGEYKIEPGMTAPELLAVIVTGKVERHFITFIEGWTFRDLRTALAQQSLLKHTINKLSDAEVMVAIGATRSQPEGLFFPDTYSFRWGNTDKDLLKRAYRKMQKLLQQQWQERRAGLLYKNAYQALIVASLVEAETSVDTERGLIAGVILNRLQKRMRLQIDPSVIYGLGRPYGSELSKKDLTIKTPYNTYLRYGLPETPIDMPGRASIIAALHPTPSQFLYYVARGDGSHQFSKTYAQHVQAINQYLKKEQVSTETQQQSQLQIKRSGGTTGKSSLIDPMSPMNNE